MNLRKLEKKDAEGMLEWMHDKEIQKCFRASMVNKTREDVLNFIESASIIPEDGQDVHYAVVDDEDIYLGTISLKNICFNDGNAEYAISLRSSAQGKGIGRQATHMLLKKAFEEIGLQRIYLNVLSENKHAISMYEKCGFIYEGEFRKHLFLRDKYYDLKWYAILKEDYESGC